MQETQFKRQTAVKVRVEDVLEGKYIDDPSQPNYIISSSGIKFSRINIVGTVVIKSKENNFPTVTLDDGTGKISVRDFDGHLIEKIDVGDLVLLICRPRKFQNTLYLVPEIVKKFDDISWIKVRKKELGMDSDSHKKEEIRDGLDPSSGVVELIRKLDSGSGVDVGQIVKRMNTKSAEPIIESLLKNGDVFEVRPGRLKLLE